MSMSLQFISESTGGRIVRGDPGLAVKGVCSDSRKLAPASLFVALRGDRFDAHDYLGDVCRGGVTAVLVESGRGDGLPGQCGIVEVPNPRAALGALAAAYRLRFGCPFVAIGGSNGKTTTKELLAALLMPSRPVMWSEGSFNNDLGVPFTLLRVEADHQAVVVEVGSNHPGELEPLLRWTRPTAGIITSIGREHLEFFGDLEGVAREEGTLADQIPTSGLLVMNADSDWTDAILRRAACRVARVGSSEGCDWRIGRVSVSPSGTSFDLENAPRDYPGRYLTSLIGRHQAVNCVLAMAMASDLGVTPGEMRQGLLNCRPAKSRMNLVERNGAWILDDSYNANADSMIAAIRTLRDLECSGRRIAVIGDMAELGAHTAAAHEEAGRELGTRGIDLLLAVGVNAAVTLESARRSGLKQGLILGGAEEALEALRRELRPGDIALVKASRSAGLDQIAKGLVRT